jgi:beta-galactosamide-alpha-2,3-sialyltransferase
MNLVLCRTPFQARLLLNYLQRKLIETNFDLIYCTDNNSKIDQYYFQELRSLSSVQSYVVLNTFRHDFITQLFLSYKLWRLTRKKQYNSVYIASLDIYYFRKIACSAKRIVVFDDGLGSFIPHETKLDNHPFRKYIYLKLLWRIPNIKDFMKMISKFLTIYSTQQPGSLLYVCPDDKIQLVEIFSYNVTNLKDSKPSINIFIGQNFYNAPDQIFIRKLKEYLNSQKVDLYLPHPQEKTPLLTGGIIYHDKTLLSEDIINFLSEYYEINLYSCFSTVIFNVHGLISNLNLILDSRSEYFENYVTTSESLNCNRIFL